MIKTYKVSFGGCSTIYTIAARNLDSVKFKVEELYERVKNFIDNSSVIEIYTEENKLVAMCSPPSNGLYYFQWQKKVN